MLKEAGGAAGLELRWECHDYIERQGCHAAVPACRPRRRVPCCMSTRRWGEGKGERTKRERRTRFLILCWQKEFINMTFSITDDHAVTSSPGLSVRKGAACSLAALVEGPVPRRAGRATDLRTGSSSGLQRSRPSLSLWPVHSCACQQHVPAAERGVLCLLALVFCSLQHPSGGEHMEGRTQETLIPSQPVQLRPGESEPQLPPVLLGLNSTHISR